jgi:alpha-beta hydrolase superfamily lysophospholipase
VTATRRIALDLAAAAYLALLGYVLLLTSGVLAVEDVAATLGAAAPSLIKVLGVVAAAFAVWLLAHMLDNRRWAWVAATVVGGVVTLPIYHFAVARKGGAARWRTAIAILLVAVAFGFGSAFFAGARLEAPAPRAVPDTALSMPHENVTFPSESGSTIHGWFVPGAAGRGVVVLMHGIRDSRLANVVRAEFLHRAGYSVLLFDFQAHGESPGRHITFGYLEARDAAAAVAYARSRRPGEPVSAIGISQGGAAALLGREPLPVRALVLEAVYPRIEHAVTNRLEVRVGPLAHALAPMLWVQMKLRLGIGVEDLAPQARIRDVVAPVFVIGGAEDRYTPVADTQALFDAAPEPKSLWIIPGAAHVDFSRFAPAEYEQRVLAFLGSNSAP